MARLVFLGLLLLAVPALRADSLASARLARALLGPDVWSRVLRLENRRTDPRHPREFHALVFAIEDRLWLYDSNEGTQSLSLYAGRLAQDEADLTPLLRHILPNLVRAQDVTDAWPTTPGPGQILARARTLSEISLPFGCFVKCFARWRTLQAGLSPPDDASVLVFYVDTSVGLQGHSVLVYRKNGRRYVYDSNDGDTPRLLPTWQDPAPLQVARSLSAFSKPVKAQLLTLHPVSAPHATVVAANAKPPGIALRETTE